MPELPEVETIARDVQNALVGRRVADARLLDAAVLRPVPPDADALAYLRGATITRGHRRAKHLLIDLVGPTGEPLLLGVQLLIYGQLLLESADAAPEPGVRLVLSLDDGREVRLADESGYARARVGPAASTAAALGLAKLGPEPLSDDFTVDRLAGILRGRRGKLKPLLLDQERIAGLGNIYVDESLWAARLHPERVAGSLTEEEAQNLHAAIRASLARGIEDRGTTFDSYRDLFGQPGGHQRNLAVFQRTGKPCPRCGTKIRRTEVGGRPTYTCPVCQPLVPPPTEAPSARLEGF